MLLESYQSFQNACIYHNLECTSFVIHLLYWFRYSVMWSLCENGIYITWLLNHSGVINTFVMSHFSFAPKEWFIYAALHIHSPCFINGLFFWVFPISSIQLDTHTNHSLLVLDNGMYPELADVCRYSLISPESLALKR